MSHLAPRTLSALRRLLIAMIATLGFLSATEAQDYIFSLPDVTLNPGTTAPISVLLDNSTGLEVSSLSTAICFDPTTVTALAAVEGAATLALDSGNGPDFFSVNLLSDAVTLGLVAALAGVEGFLPAPAHEFMVITFQASGAPNSSTALSFCSAGVPLVTNLVIFGPSQVNIGPALLNGSITIGPFQGAELFLDTSSPAVQGDTVTVTVLLGSSEDVTEIEFGMTTDPTNFSLNSVTPIGGLAAANGGSGPSILDVVDAPGGVAGAFTVSAIVDFTLPVQPLPAGLAQPILELEFAVAPGAGPLCTETPLFFVAGLGTPAIPVLVGSTAGPLITVAEDGALTIVGPPAVLPSGGTTLSLETVASAPGQLAAVTIGLDSSSAVSAVSFGVDYDSTDITLIGVDQGADLTAARCGLGPELFLAEAILGVSGGVTVEMIVETTAPLRNAYLLPADLSEFVILRFSIVPNPTFGETALTFTGALGTPAVPLEIETGTGLITPATVPGLIDYGVSFVRGNCNVDAAIDLADAIFVLGFLFPGGGTPAVITCGDACDINDDGGIDVADAISLLGVLFGGTGPIPAPSSCDLDPTEPDGLACVSFAACP